MIRRTTRWESTQRYYELYVGEDLFGEAILVKVWGGKGTARGGSSTLAGTRASLKTAEQLIAAKRRQRGYVEVACARCATY